MITEEVESSIGLVLIRETSILKISFFLTVMAGITK